MKLIKTVSTSIETAFNVTNAVVTQGGTLVIDVLEASTAFSGLAKRNAQTYVKTQTALLEIKEAMATVALSTDTDKATKLAELKVSYIELNELLENLGDLD